MRSFRFRAALAAALLAATPATARQAAPPHAHPGLWVIRDADTTIWLFGTIHALPKDYAWRDATLDRAFASAKELIVEAKLDTDPARSAALFMRMATDKKGLPPLAARVRPRYRATLAKMMAKTELPKATLDGMESWAAAVTLVGVSLDDLGVSADVGVEEQLKAMFAANHRPIDAFETPEQQLGYFDALPESEQRAFLESVIDAPETDRKEFAAMLAAWARGDQQSIVKSFDKDLKASPLLRRVLLDRRNARWADAIARRLGQPGSVLVAVGAGHLAGPQSVQKMLEARGIKVKRVE